MSLRPIKDLMVVGSVFLLSIGVAPAQTPSPEAMSAARSLVTTLKLSDQYKALFPVILLSIKPALVQGRPEIERDYDAMTATVANVYTPHYNAMVDSIATVYASNFSVDELRDTRCLLSSSGWTEVSGEVHRPSRSRPRRSARMAVAKPPRICELNSPTCFAKKATSFDGKSATVIGRVPPDGRRLGHPIANKRMGAHRLAVVSGGFGARRSLM